MKKLLLLCFLFLHSFLLQAQWNPDTLLQTIVANRPGTQTEAAICSDGQKGAYVSWSDFQYSPGRAYIQHIDSSGFIQWPLNGISIADTTLVGFGPSNTHLAPDSKGGVIVVYTQTALGGADHIYAQHIDKTGQLLWNPPVNIDVSADARLLNAKSDEHGGAIINWYRYLSGVQVAIQWIDSTGTPYFPLNGMAITNNTNVHYDSQIAYAGSPTLMMAFVAYTDNDTLRLQGIDTSGTMRFATPVTLDTSFVRNSGDPAAGYTISPSPGVNRAIVAWESQQGNQAECVRAQSINSNGTINWNPNGIVVDSSTAYIHYPVVSCKDGPRRGAYIAYGFNNLYLQHLSALGQKMFPSGLGTCNAPGIGQSYPQLVPDGSGGLLIGWEDGRGNLGVYAQRYDSLGTALWRPCGTPVFNPNNGGSVNNMRMISRADGTGIAAWLSNINGSSDVFAGNVENISITGIVEHASAMKTLSIYPNPATDNIHVLVDKNYSAGIVTVFDLSGKVVIGATNFSGSAFTVSTKTLQNGLYLLQTENSGTINRALFCIE